MSGLASPLQLDYRLHQDRRQLADQRHIWRQRRHHYRRRHYNINQRPSHYHATRLQPPSPHYLLSTDQHRLKPYNNIVSWIWFLEKVCFVVYSTRRLVLYLTSCHFVLVFFSPFSIAITSLGEERANLSAFHTFVRFVLVSICRFPLPLGVWERLRFVIVVLPGLFSYPFLRRSRRRQISLQT